ncbi:excisionase family DNA-binding protein [Oryzobacter sp. R7]|uniref:excisionase family DNA-binding protein n=1 Tax=Oryzobacter faecalis TaxID=3388656 RepID=UPI00398CD3A2
MTQTSRRHYESLAEAAERTGVSTRTPRRRISCGELTAYRAGPRIIRLDPDDVDRLLVRVPNFR